MQQHQQPQRAVSALVRPPVPTIALAKHVKRDETELDPDVSLEL